MPDLNDLSSEYVSSAKYSMQVIFENILLIFFIFFFLYFGFSADKRKENNSYLIIYAYITMLIYALIRLIAKQTADNTIRR